MATNVHSLLADGAPEVIVDPLQVTTSASDAGPAVNPFKGVTFEDSDTLTVSISFASDDGALVVPEGLELLAFNDEGGLKTYTFVGRADALAVVMDVLQFQATPRPMEKAGTIHTTTFTISTTDGTSTVVNEAIQVTATVANRAPTDISLSGDGVIEMMDIGTVVGTLSVSDQAETNIRYELMDPTGRFGLDETGTRIVVKNPMLVDFEASGGVYKVKVKAIDKDDPSLFIEKTISITVKDWEDEMVIGSDGPDVIMGGLGSDTLYGGDGNDTLYGGEGNDFLDGEAGRDVFVFNTALDRTANVDTISSFSVKDDTIQLENAIFAKLTKTGTLGSSFFTIGPKAKDKNDYIIYDNKKGHLYYDADGSGKGAAVLFAKVSKNLKMTYKDFYVI